MDDTIFSINGRIVPPEEAVVPATDRGFLYGDGAFETIHAYGPKLFRLREHLARLAHAMQRLFFAPAPSPAVLARWLAEAVATAGFPEANVRLTVSRGSGPRGPSVVGAPPRGRPAAASRDPAHRATSGFRPTVAIMATRFARSDGRTNAGVRAVLASFRRQESAVTARLKTLNYMEQVIARHEADLARADEAILLNSAGLLCEGSASNISLIRRGALAIPDPARAGALQGIAQLTAIQAARNLGLPVALTVLSPWDLTQADEAFLSGSMREVTPLVRVGDAPIGNGRPGPITMRLIAEYRRIVERECAPFRYGRT
ncbi:MAG: aminotransferase class IV [Planctomycetota bacterium]|nr:aminotransferase class IV [Planctomycetota bacterium]